MSTLEEAGKANPKIRPVHSSGKGGGKVWVVNIEEKFDISKSSP